MMEKQKKEQLILLALVAVLIILLPAMLFRKKPVSHKAYMAELPGAALRQQPQPQAGPAVGEAGAVSVGVQSQLPEITEITGPPPKDLFEMPADLQKKFTQDESELNESEAGAGEMDLPSVHIDGIVWGGDKPLAFIDGKVYKIGDSVSDAQITGIDKKGVYFLYRGEKVLMKFKK